MTPMDQALSRASEGQDASEISSHADSRRARNASGRGTKPATLQQQIEVLFKTGLSDAEIAARLGCKTPYVRVARQRAGLFRSTTGKPKGR